MIHLLVAQGRLPGILPNDSTYLDARNYLSCSRFFSRGLPNTSKASAVGF